MQDRGPLSSGVCSEVCPHVGLIQGHDSVRLQHHDFCTIKESDSSNLVLFSTYAYHESSWSVSPLFAVDFNIGLGPDTEALLI
jgi:hypothetical protein